MGKAGGETIVQKARGVANVTAVVAFATVEAVFVTKVPQLATATRKFATVPVEIATETLKIATAIQKFVTDSNIKYCNTIQQHHRDW